MQGAWVRSLVRELDPTCMPQLTVCVPQLRSPPATTKTWCNQINKYFFKNWASLVAQWLRIRLPMQVTRVRALVREDPTCHETTKPLRHNYWACALEPASHNYWACMPQLLKAARLEPVLRNKGSHRNEKPAHRNEEQPPLATTREKPTCSNKDPTQPKIK